MSRLVSGLSIAGLMAGALTLGGCATVKSVENAQLTADHAMSQAQAGTAAAQRAQSAADAAMSAAQAAAAAAQRAQGAAETASSAAQAAAGDAHRANDRLDHQTPVVEHMEHHHHHQTWRHVAHKGGHAMHHAKKHRR